ncbi:MAG: ClpXP protease specificity-enhancing factor SspB, partial [Pseudomonadota bacterium]
MTEDLLQYDKLVERALKNVVREALRHVAEHGLRGAHHLYITFRTDHPGVMIPDELKSKYPIEMTIVLQYQFWDLLVGDE